MIVDILTQPDYTLPILERREPYRYKDRPTYWFDRNSFLLIKPDGTEVYTKDGSLAAAIYHMDRNEYNQRLFLLGGDIASTSIRLYWLEQMQKYGWSCSLFKNERMATITKSSYKIEIYCTSLWFSDVPDIHTARKAYYMLREHLQTCKEFEKSYLLPTAASTGLDLVKISLPERKQYPILPDELRSLIYHNMYQGRNETFYHPGVPIDRIYGIDERWAYAACARHLPVGPYIHDTKSELPANIYAPGFFKVTARVPDNWRHIGLIKFPVGGEFDGDETDTPGAYPFKPGMEITNWITGAELHLLLYNSIEPWEVKIHERLFWPKEESYDVLGKWISNLRMLRDSCDQYGELEPYVAGAIRHIVLDTVGSFHRHHVKVKHITPRSMSHTLPPEAKNTWIWHDMKLEGFDYIEWMTREELAPTETSHPEWSATVWGRTRARLAKAALRLPFESIVALRSDEIWSTYDITKDSSWIDTGKPGSWRIKEQHLRPIGDKPKETKEWLVIMRRIRERREV